MVIRQPANGRPLRTVRFGSVEVTGPAPTPEEIARGVRLSDEAVDRLANADIPPGIHIEDVPDAPLYWVAEGEPGVFIRKLNGRTERGVLADGAFKVIE